MRIIRHILTALTLGLLCTAATALQAQNLTVKITQTDNIETTVTEQASLQAAMGSTPLAQVLRLEISAGTFKAADWDWLKNNRNDLKALTHFTITDGITETNSIPYTESTMPYFGNQLLEVSVAKVEAIGRYAFKGCTSLTTASFPQTTIIRLLAFDGCTALTSASFPLATTIEACAFQGCTSLTTASFPQVTTMEDRVFDGCTSLTTANFPLVTIIRANVFKDCTALATVSFPLATSIPANTFKNYRTLTSVNFSKAAAIGDYAFMGCTALTSASFPQATSIGGYAFKGCTALTSASFPQATSIGERTFYGCTALTSASFPQATSIWAEAFYNCTVLTTTSFPLVTTIGANVFENCTALTTVSFPQATTIGVRAFISCTSLTLASFPQVTKIGLYAFKYCPALVNLMLGETPPSNVDFGAFDAYIKYRYLILVDIDGSLLTGSTLTNAIAAYKANNSYNSYNNTWNDWYIDNTLYTVTVAATNTNELRTSHSYTPAGIPVKLIPIPKMGNGALQTLTCTGQSGSTLTIDMDTYTFVMPTENVTVSATFASNTISVTANGSDHRTGTSLQDALNGIELSSINSLEVTSGNFQSYDWAWLRNNRSSLNALTHFTITNGADFVAEMPDGNSPYFGKQVQVVSVVKVTKIWSNAFYEYTSLTEVHFPEVKSIGDEAFRGCTALTTASIPKATDIGVYTFYGCTSLTEANFPQAESIGKEVFRGCNALAIADFPQVTSIGDYAFYECTSLTEANFLHTESIGKNTFSSCIALASTNFPQVKSIGNYAFQNCTSLIEVNFPLLESIRSYVFLNCTALISAIFPQVESIGGEAFRECTSLATASFPKATNIGQQAFSGCTSFTSLMLGATPPSTVGNDAFANCPETRYLILVDNGSAPLTNTALTNAKAAYKAATDGNSDDNQWYSWILDLPTYTHTVSVAADLTNGTITIEPNTNVAIGTQVILTAKPATGYRIKEGSLVAYKNGDRNTPTLVIGNFFIMPDFDVTVTCEFEELPFYTITMAAGISGGTLSAEPSTNAIEGEQVKLTTTPTAGYRLKEGSLMAYKTGEEATTVAITDGKFTMPAYNVTVTCEFEEVPFYTITVAADISGGTLTAEPSTNIIEGEQVKLTATPAMGYRLKANSLKAYKTGEVATIIPVTDGKFTMPAYDVTVTCEFENTTGVEIEEPQLLALYPNPSQHGFYIESMQGEHLLQVFNAIGVEVLQQRINGKTYVDLSAQPAGVYLVRIGNRTVRLIKQ